MQRPYAPFRHNVDGADHARAFRVTDAGGANIRVAAGRARIDQAVTNFAAATPLGPLANGTNYIYISAAAPPVISALLAGPYPANSIPLARVVVAAGDITGITDDRCFFYEDTAAGGGGNTLDQAYDQGGAGAGRTIVADSGRVQVTTDGFETTNLVLNKSTELIDANDEIALPSTGWVYLNAGGAADNLLGIVAGTEGQRVWLTPTAGKDITLIHNSGATVAGQPLMINGEANVLLDQDHDMAIAVYDAVAAVWNVLVPGAGAGGVQSRIQDADNDTYVETDAGGADPDRVQMGVAGVERFNLSASGLRLDDNLAMNCALDPNRVINVIGTYAAWAANWEGLAILPSLTTTGNNRSGTGMYGAMQFQGAGGSVGHTVNGLAFNAILIHVGAIGTITANTVRGVDIAAGAMSISSGLVTATEAQCIYTNFDGVVQMLGAVSIPDLSAYYFKGKTLNDGNIFVNNAYGLYLGNIDGTSFTNKYLIHAGPATPYLRLMGGAAPGANQTNLYLNENGNLRRVQWMDPGAGGANFVGGEKVMVMV